MRILVGFIVFIVTYIGGSILGVQLIMHVLKLNPPALLGLLLILISCIAGILLMTLVPYKVAKWAADTTGGIIEAEKARIKKLEWERDQETKKRELEIKRKQDEERNRIIAEQQQKLKAIEEEKQRKLAIEQAEKARVRQQFIDTLLASDSIIKQPGGDEVVICANGHVYRQNDFHIDRQYTATSYERVSRYNRYDEYAGQSEVPVTEIHYDSQWGCPLCRTSIFSYKDQRYNKYRSCGCGYWYHPDRHNACPICTHTY